ncbi:hypothetical protein NNX39_12355 [Arthrobacter sp. zg-Y826]|uniref:hypothetical protein n=1 Tax=Arthrobacter jinronghuae TaxID=2964609 RepID=UPI002106DAA2|nr:hypothetical protein [Arthrobacter jinronghuae]MCQ1957292.1 hypothetical protein [Arthrobacter jinronghuae]
MDSNAVLVLNEYRANQAKGRRDFALAISHSRVAAEAATLANDSRSFCRMTFNVGEIQLEMGLMEDCIETCTSLLTTAAIKEYADYESRVRVLMTRALHDLGQMEEALSAAREASNLPMQELSSDSRLSVQHVLIAALAEDGDTEGAWQEAMRLIEMLPTEAPPRVAGMAYWTVGNAAFLSGRVDEGLNYHRLAADSFSLLNDVGVWALFNKASAHMRLVAGLVQPETGECLDRAEVAFGVAGVTEMDRLEIAITRAWWELESGNAVKAEETLRSLEKQIAGTHLFLQGRTLLMLGRCLHVLERKSEALECAQQSEKILGQVGADVFASEARELVTAISNTAQ